jgi:hypothetical protein
MLKIEINREPTPKGQLMNDRELTKILAMINSKVKRDVTITYADIEEQVLRTILKECHAQLNKFVFFVFCYVFITHFIYPFGYAKIGTPKRRVRVSAGRIRH